GVSRHTIRVSMTSLHDMGLVSSHQGVGNIVRASSAPVRYAQSFDSLGDLHQYAANTPVEITSITEVVADASLAQWLDCQQEEAWWRINTIRYSRGKSARVAASEVFIPSRFGAVLDH